jgi:CheY-like chemotaxis protein
MRRKTFCGQKSNKQEFVNLSRLDESLIKFESTQVEFALVSLDDVQPENSTRRVLLVEDSSVTQDLIHLILSQRGHSIDMFDTGAGALEALKSKTYDIALLDFHLPDFSGLQVVRDFLDAKASYDAPRFVAITGDVKGLLADPANCEVFDEIVPKPLDIDEVCRLVEETNVKPSEGAPETLTPRRSPSNATNSPLDALDYSYLIWPRDTDISDEDVHHCDAVVVTRAQNLDQLWNKPRAHLLPVIDLSGDLGPQADFDASKNLSGRLSEIQLLIESFHGHRRSLHKSFVKTAAAADRILARIKLSGGTLMPATDVTQKGMVSYNTIADAQQIVRELEKLNARGHVELTFQDRVHVCDTCEGSRFNVREECPSCHSPHLEEASYIHHFRCAYQGPESDFQSGDQLICPKCSRRLSHFGSDYDRPGTVVTCKACSHSTSEPSVGFICGDCGTRTDGDAVQTRDVMSATLTKQAESYLKAGPSFLGLTSQSLRFADLPIDLVVALNRAAQAFTADQTPFALSYIRYDAEEDLIDWKGHRQVSKLRKQFLEQFAQKLGPDTLTVRGTAYDFVLGNDIASDAFMEALETAAEVIKGDIAHDLMPRFQLFGPSDLIS